MSKQTNDTLIVKTGVITEVCGKEVRYLTYAQTWDGSLYYEVGDATLTNHEACVERARYAVANSEHVNNGCWIKGSLG